MKKSIFIFIIILTFFSTQYTAGQVDAFIKNDTINQYNNNEKKHGFWIEKNQKNQLKEIGFYTNSKKNGVWKTFYPNDTLKSTIEYKNGFADGIVKMYYPNGNIQETGIWKISYWIGDYKYYTESGNMYHHFNFSPYGTRHGMQYYYFANGNLSIKGKWDKGLETGWHFEYTENGKLKWKKYYNNGKCDYNKSIYYLTDSTISDTNIVNTPILDTISIAGIENINDTESIKSQIKKQIIETGHFVLTNNTGYIFQEGFFKDGKLNKGAMYIYKNNILTQIIFYKNGKQNTSYKIETKTGK